MRHQIDPEVARLIADSRKAVETSRRILAQSKRELEGLRAEIEESRRVLEATRRVGPQPEAKTVTPGRGTGMSRRASPIL